MFTRVSSRFTLGMGSRNLSLTKCAVFIHAIVLLLFLGTETVVLTAAPTGHLKY